MNPLEERKHRLERSREIYAKEKTTYERIHPDFKDFDIEKTGWTGAQNMHRKRLAWIVLMKIIREFSLTEKTAQGYVDIIQYE